MHVCLLVCLHDCVCLCVSMYASIYCVVFVLYSFLKFVEAGKLLLENFDEYASRARLMTRLHAKKQPKGVEQIKSNTTQTFLSS